jgi:hypothetical protein
MNLNQFLCTPYLTYSSPCRVVNTLRARSSRSSSNESRLLRDGQILHRVLEDVVITIAIHPIVFFLLTRTSVLVVGWLVLKIKLQYHQNL